MSALEDDFDRLQLTPDGKERITTGELTAALSRDGAGELMRDCLDALNGGIISPALTYLLFKSEPNDRPDPICLGESTLFVSMGQSTINVWRSRESWEAHGRDGIVILDWDECARELLVWPTIVAEGIELGERIEAAIKSARHRLSPSNPYIMVRPNEQADFS